LREDFWEQWNEGGYSDPQAVVAAEAQQEVETLRQAVSQKDKELKRGCRRRHMDKRRLCKVKAELDMTKAELQIWKDCAEELRDGICRECYQQRFESNR
jgi:hypothetical protein